MSNNHATIEELLVATEGEHIQFKEAKTALTLAKRRGFAVRSLIEVAANW
jgi:hypothetical protein